MTEGTLSAEELAELKALLKKPMHTVGDVYLSTELLAEAVPALIAEVEALKHDIGRHMDALLAAETVEAVARAMCRADHDGLSMRPETLDGQCDLKWHHFESMAVAALAAIRSRTQETSRETS